MNTKKNNSLDQLIAEFLEKQKKMEELNANFEFAARIFFKKINKIFQNIALLRTTKLSDSDKEEVRELINSQLRDNKNFIKFTDEKITIKSDLIAKYGSDFANDLEEILFDCQKLINAYGNINLQVNQLVELWNSSPRSIIISGL